MVVGTQDSNLPGSRPVAIGAHIGAGFKPPAGLVALDCQEVEARGQQPCGDRAVVPVEHYADAAGRDGRADRVKNVVSHGSASASMMVGAFSVIASIALFQPNLKATTSSSDFGFPSQYSLR